MRYALANLAIVLLLTASAPAAPAQTAEQSFGYTFETSIGSMSVTSDSISYSLASKDTTVARDMLAALYRPTFAEDRYPWIPDDVEVLLIYGEHEGLWTHDDPPSWPPLGRSADADSLFDELNTEIDALLDQRDDNLTTIDQQAGRITTLERNLAAITEASAERIAAYQDSLSAARETIEDLEAQIAAGPGQEDIDAAVAEALAAYEAGIRAEVDAAIARIRERTAGGPTQPGQ